MSRVSTPGYNYSYPSAPVYGSSPEYGFWNPHDCGVPQPPGPALPPNPALPSLVPRHTSVHYGPVMFGNRGDLAQQPTYAVPVASGLMAPPPPPPKPYQPLPGWKQKVDPSSGRHYYEDTVNGTTQWGTAYQGCRKATASTTSQPWSWSKSTWWKSWKRSW